MMEEEEGEKKRTCWSYQRKKVVKNIKISFKEEERIQYIFDLLYLSTVSLLNIIITCWWVNAIWHCLSLWCFFAFLGILEKRKKTFYCGTVD